jgi:hypothetical protein
MPTHMAVEAHLMRRSWNFLQKKVKREVGWMSERGHVRFIGSVDRYSDFLEPSDSLEVAE